jgi:rRNA maturation endonuclease Nob1
MAPNVPEAEFCVECRARVAPLRCAGCDTVNDADATFCKKCGASLAAADTAGSPS